MRKQYKIFSLFIIGGLVGASIVFSVWALASRQQNKTLSGPIEYNCELSGGRFENENCTCSLELNQTQDEMYDQETGFCQTTFGGPGGDAFEASIGLPYGSYGFWTSIVVDLCEQSGGSMSGAACICPSEPSVAGTPAYTYSKETGLCMDSFGIPGGEQGETAKKLQEFEMLKNE